MTGKTTICIDAIINQKNKDVVCIYCFVGRSYSALHKVVEVLKAKGALDYTIIVVAHAACSSGEQYLSPYTACALGEYFMDQGKDVFIVYDDLSKHAWAYRQLSLLLERPPGREAYPGDIFYLHSQLMERAGKYSPEFGGGSMTFFPIVETIQGEVTGYVPSNLISMTDGQIYLNTTLFNSGTRPAIDLSLSVSRIGNKVQSKAMKELSSMLRLEYVRYMDLLKLTRFKTTVSDDVSNRLRQGNVMTGLFVQTNNEPYPFAKQIILLYALKRTILGLLSIDDLKRFKQDILKFAENKYPRLIRLLNETKELSPEVTKSLDGCLISFFKEKDIYLEQGSHENKDEESYM
jgi:F-type H+-transporting ATPase subunit alpha